MNEEKDRRFYLRWEPVILTALLAMVVVFFLAVTGLSHAFYAQQAALAQRWYGRGVTDLQQQRYPAAVEDFRTALRYSRDNYRYQLKLVEALIGEGQSGEASAYLVNLWDREPENGLVNLELARIAAQKGGTEQALRYYHNAIYATWTEGQAGKQSDDQVAERRKTRLELIEYLLRIGDRTQAQSELIALAANLGNEPALHMRAGELFFQAGDYEHALEQYSLTLKEQPRNPAALAGAGQAAFKLGRYGPAERYLQACVTTNPGNAQLAEQLSQAELVMRMDPFRRGLRMARRDGIVMEAFAAAGDRLKACPAAGEASAAGATAGASKGAGATGAATGAGAPQTLAGSWTKMKPEITKQGLRRNPELVEPAMELVFEIERQSSTACGALSGQDMALLRIAKLHPGSQ